MFAIPSEIKHCSRPAYLVGGAVRDMLLGLAPVDYDIAVPGDPQKFARELSGITGTHVIPLGKNEKYVLRIVSKDIVYDITPLAGPSIREDLENRDFTINSMAYDLYTGNLIDITGAKKDLNQRCIRMVSPQVFQKDPVRLIRAFRIALTTGFNIEKDTMAAIRSNRHLISSTAGERVRDELFGILRTDASRTAIHAMADTGLLLEIFPELKGLEGCRQNRHHEFNVWQHTLNTFTHLEVMLDSMERLFPKSSNHLTGILDPKRKAILKLAALLHDIGKPASQSIDDKGRCHFYGHAKIGSQMALAASERLRFSRKEQASVAFIIERHLRPLFLFQQSRSASLSAKALTRFFLSCNDLTPDILLHAVADSRGKTHQTDDTHTDFVRFTRDLLQRYFNGFQEKQSAPPLITGHDLISRFDLSPSPLFKTILKQIEEAKLSGEIGGRDEAFLLVEKFLDRMK